MHVTRVVMLAALVFIAACSFVRITPTGNGLTVQPRPRNCQIEFFHTKAPERLYDELAAFHASFGEPKELQEEMRVNACQLGADAVIVTREYVPADQSMAGTAVKYRETSAAPGAQSPSAERQ